MLRPYVGVHQNGVNKPWTQYMKGGDKSINMNTEGNHWWLTYYQVRSRTHGSGSRIYAKYEICGRI